MVASPEMVSKLLVGNPRMVGELELMVVDVNQTR